MDIKLQENVWEKNFNILECLHDENHFYFVKKNYQNIRGIIELILSESLLNLKEPLPLKQLNVLNSEG